jgi:hypothetical protein
MFRLRWAGLLALPFAFQNHAQPRSPRGPIVWFGQGFVLRESWTGDSFDLFWSSSHLSSFECKNQQQSKRNVLPDLF